MPDMYIHLTFDEYKALEEQMKEFSETSHGDGTDWYHKSIRLKIGEGLTMEFHGPNVKAREILKSESSNHRS